MGGDRFRPASTAASRRRAPRRFAGPSTRKAPPGFGGPEARGPAGSFRRRRRSVGLVFLGAMPVEGAVAGIDREPPERAVAAAADGDFARSPVDPAVERRHRREDHEGAGEVPQGTGHAGRGHRARCYGTADLPGGILTSDPRAPVRKSAAGSRRARYGGTGEDAAGADGGHRGGRPVRSGRRRGFVGPVFLGAMPVAAAGNGRELPERGVAAAADGDFARSPADPAVEQRHRREDDEGGGGSPGRAQASPEGEHCARRYGAADLRVGGLPTSDRRVPSPEVGGGESGRVPRPPPGEASPSGGVRAPRGSGGRFRVGGGQSASYSSARCMSKAPWRGSTGNRRNSAWQR